MSPTSPNLGSEQAAIRFISEGLNREGTRPIPRKLQTILLVDDDDALREVMEACLRMMGYVVIACNEAETASLAFHSSAVDLLLTDLQMPGRSGTELARELTLLRPALPVTIVSGSIPSDDLLGEIRKRNWKFVAKPCSLTLLLGSIKASLSSVHEYAA